MQNNSRSSLKINPEYVSYTTCECGNDVFQQLFKLGRASMIANPALPRDVDVVVPVFACSKCGQTNDMTMEGAIN